MICRSTICVTDGAFLRGDSPDRDLGFYDVPWLDAPRSEAYNALVSKCAAPTSKQPTVIDLFCGAGGLSLGFQNAGFSILHGYDSWQPAVATYAANFAHQVLPAEINDATELPPADVLIGGPPCQGFSSAGLRRGDDDRNTLITVFAGLVAQNRPRAFVFENVEGFLTGGHGRFVFELLTPLVQVGYRIHLRKINAANYGVPQHRKRVIAVGGLGWDPSFPKATHSAYGAPGAHLASRCLPPTPTLADALAGLPPAKPAHTRRICGDDHVFTPLSSDDSARAKLLMPGWCMRDLPQELWHPSYHRRAYRRVMDGTPSERRGGPPAGLRRLRGDEPSKAITGGAMSEFLHPTENRSLTVRECARLQTFPDDFRFVGSFRDIIQLIGNAVPPLFAERIALNLHTDLLQARVRTGSGALLSFVPTLSNGASPVLSEVIARVDCAFRTEGAPGQLDLQWA